MSSKVLSKLQKKSSHSFPESETRCSLEKVLWKSPHRCFPMNFAKFLRTFFFPKHLWRLLLVFIHLFIKVSFYIGYICFIIKLHSFEKTFLFSYLSFITELEKCTNYWSLSMIIIRARDWLVFWKLVELKFLSKK